MLSDEIYIKERLPQFFLWLSKEDRDLTFEQKLEMIADHPGSDLYKAYISYKNKFNFIEVE